MELTQQPLMDGSDAQSRMMWKAYGCDQAAACCEIRRMDKADIKACLDIKAVIQKQKEKAKSLLLAIHTVCADFNTSAAAYRGRFFFSDEECQAAYGDFCRVLVEIGDRVNVLLDLSRGLVEQEARLRDMRAMQQKRLLTLLGMETKDDEVARAGHQALQDLSCAIQNQLCTFRNWIDCFCVETVADFEKKAARALDCANQGTCAPTRLLSLCGELYAICDEALKHESVFIAKEKGS